MVQHQNGDGPMPREREAPDPTWSLFDTFDQPVSVFSPEGKYRYINNAGRHLLGETIGELVGRSYLELFPDLAEHPFHAAFQRVASGAASFERLEFHYAPLGLWSSQRMHRTNDDIVVFWENVTARKEAEAKLDEALERATASERLFRSMIEGMPQLAWTARADGFIDYYNPRWYEFTGTTPEDMEGWGWQSVHDPTLLPEVMQRWERSIATGESFEMEFPLRRHDGVFRWFLTRVAPTRDDAGAVVRWVGINTDIHTQKTALRQLDDTLESMSDAFLLLDRDWRMVRANRNQEKVSRVSRENSLGRVFWEVFPATSKPSSKYWQEYHRAMEQRVAVHFLEYYEPLDVWTEVDAFPAQEGGLAVFFRDVTLRERASQALAEERAVLDALFREVPVGLAVFDDQFRYLRLNAVLAEMNGLPIETHLGKPVADVLPALPAAKIDQWREVLRTGRPVVGAEVVGSRAKDPAVVRVWKESYFPVRVGDKTLGLGTMVEDVTEERRIAEERLEALSALETLAETSAALGSSLVYEETLARLVQSAVPRLADACSVYVIAEDGSIEQVAASHVDAEKADVMRAIHRGSPLDADLPFGYPKVLRTGQTELVTEVTTEMLERASRNPRHLELINKLELASWIVVPLTTRGRTSGAMAFAWTGRSRKYRSADVPLAEEIGRRASLAIENARLYRDATVALESERRARDKAEEATRLKDEFLATLSHELRTPLNAILGWGRLLQTGSVPEEKKSKALDTIVRNAVAQNQLIDDLLDVSRIISGKLRLNVDSIDINQILEAAIDVVRPAADAKGVRLQPLLDPDAGLISGDAGRLQQIVWNLLTNAVKFTPRGGRVHIVLRREESCIAISVADTGVGIAAEFLPYVFHRFRQQDGAITRRAGGLGLGLAIVKNLVELHGGSVSARSDGEGKGATFVVKIPIAPVTSRPILQSERAASSPSTGPLEVACPSEVEGLKILVIDDEPDARDLIRTVLEHCHALVTTAGSAAEALESLRSEIPDVIVSDIGMPDEDGYSFIRRLRARTREQGGSVPAVALTAYARPEDRTRALLEGFQSHASKPIDPQELLIVIANLAGRFS